MFSPAQAPVRHAPRPSFEKWKPPAGAGPAIQSSRTRFAGRLNSGVSLEKQHVASSSSALLEALRDRAVRGKHSRVLLFNIHATSCTQRARMDTCCGGWGNDRFRPGISIVGLGFPAQSTCSHSWRSASNCSGIGCLVRAECLTI